MTVSSQELDALYREIADPKSWHWKIEERTGWFGHKTAPAPQRHVTEVLHELEKDGQQEEAQKLLTSLTALYHTFKEERADEASAGIEAIFGVNKSLSARHEELLKTWGFPVDDPQYAPLKAMLLECWGELVAVLGHSERARDQEKENRDVLNELRQLWDQGFLHTPTDVRDVLNELKPLKYTGDDASVLSYSNQFSHLCDPQHQARDLLRLVRLFVMLVRLNLMKDIDTDLSQVYHLQSWTGAANKNRDLVDLETLVGLFKECHDARHHDVDVFTSPIMMVYWNVTSDGRFAPPVAVALVRALFKDPAADRTSLSAVALGEFGALLSSMENAPQLLQLIRLLLRIGHVTASFGLDDVIASIKKREIKGEAVLEELRAMLLLDEYSRGNAAHFTSLMILCSFLRSQGCDLSEAQGFVTRWSSTFDENVSGMFYSILKNLVDECAFEKDSLIKVAERLDERCRTLPSFSGDARDTVLLIFSLAVRGINVSADDVIAIIDRFFDTAVLLKKSSVSSLSFRIWCAILDRERRMAFADRFKLFDDLIAYIKERGDALNPLLELLPMCLFIKDLNTVRETADFLEKYRGALRHLSGLRSIRGFHFGNMQELEQFIINVNSWERYGNLNLIQALIQLPKPVLVATGVNAYNGDDPEQKIKDRINKNNTKHSGYEFNPSCVLIAPNSVASVVQRDNRGSVGVIFDFGFIYDASHHDSYSFDVPVKRKRDNHFGAANEPLLWRRISSRGTGGTVASVAQAGAVDHNEVLISKWSVGALFCTRGTSAEYLAMLKKVSCEESFEQHINGAHYYRKAFVLPGGPEKMIKVFPIIEIDPADNSWRVIYTPEKPGWVVKQIGPMTWTAVPDGRS